MTKAMSLPAEPMMSPNPAFDPSSEGKALEAATPTSPGKMSEDEKKRIMRMIEDEDSSDEDDESDKEDKDSNDNGAAKEKDGNGSANDSFCSDNDILNRSL